MRVGFSLYTADGLRHVDVKAEKWILKSWRVSFEKENVYHDGFRKLTWGMDPNLHIIAAVAIPSPLCIFIDLPKFRDIVLSARPEQKLPYGWAVFSKENDRYDTIGWAVSPSTSCSETEPSSRWCICLPETSVGWCRRHQWLPD